MREQNIQAGGQLQINHPAIRYHGGKFRLASWITSHFPPHRIYVEPYGGAASVLLRKAVSQGEVYNDLDGDVVNLFRMLRDPVTRQALSEACALTPYSRDEFNLAYMPTEEPVERARRLVVRATMGFGSAGATMGKTGFRLGTKRDCSTTQRIWSLVGDNLAAVGQRFAGVLIENRDGCRCMLDHDTPDTLHFVDPPYLQSTRSEATRNRVYRFEMNDIDHQNLVNVVRSLQGMVVLCGYDNHLYNLMLSDWKRVSRTVAANGRTGSVQRTECLWLNPALQEKIYG